jgi:hypothetical protein
MLGWASACFKESPGLEPDALSLSHLTCFDATITVRFHRLDHPPFPCTARLRRVRIGSNPLSPEALHTQKQFISLRDTITYG